jgi:hypothetical protein
LSIDGCMTKAPLGGKKDGQKSHRSRQIGSQTQSVGRERWHPAWLGRRRSQPQ